MERIELFWVANDMESEIYLFIKLTTGTFDDVTDVKSAKKPGTVTPTAIEHPHPTEFYVVIMS